MSSLMSYHYGLPSKFFSSITSISGIISGCLVSAILKLSNESVTTIKSIDSIEPIHSAVFDELPRPYKVKRTHYNVDNLESLPHDGGLNNKDYGFYCIIDEDEFIL